MLIGRIATGEVEDTPSEVPGRDKGGKIGGKRRAAALNPDLRKKIAKKAAATRWNGRESKQEIST
jgi:hypothetical protein